MDLKSLALQVITAGGIFYLGSVYYYFGKNKKEVSRSNYSNEPLNYSIWLSEKHVQTRDNNEEVHPSGDWNQVQNQILAHTEQDYTSIPSINMNDGLYFGERVFYDLVNYVV